MERTGWWSNFNQTLSILSHHPVCGVKVAGAPFSLPQPPLLARSWPGGAIGPNGSSNSQTNF